MLVDNKKNGDFEYLPRFLGILALVMLKIGWLLKGKHIEYSSLIILSTKWYLFALHPYPLWHAQFFPIFFPSFLSLGYFLIFFFGHHIVELSPPPNDVSDLSAIFFLDSIFSSI